MDNICFHTLLRASDVANLSMQILEGIMPGPFNRDNKDNGIKELKRDEMRNSKL